jgi:hypothetical protein
MNQSHYDHCWNQEPAASTNSRKELNSHQDQYSIHVYRAIEQRRQQDSQHVSKAKEVQNFHKAASEPSKGQKLADFNGNHAWDGTYQDYAGTSTREISLRRCSVLNK